MLGWRGMIWVRGGGGSALGLRFFAYYYLYLLDKPQSRNGMLMFFPGVLSDCMGRRRMSMTRPVGLIRRFSVLRRSSPVGPAGVRNLTGRLRNLSNVTGRVGLP